MLYSHDAALWKIADFGLTAPGTSRRRQESDYSRGTAGYRAPELINEAPSFNNKTDIWALGCILVELTTRKQAFVEDWDVRDFALVEREFKLNIDLLSLGCRRMTGELSALVANMLHRDPAKRPSAKTLFDTFATYCKSGAPSYFVKLPTNEPRNSPRTIREKYQLWDFNILRIISTGRFGPLHIAQSRHNSRFYVIKV